MRQNRSHGYSTTNVDCGPALTAYLPSRHAERSRRNPQEFASHRNRSSWLDYLRRTSDLRRLFVVFDLAEHNSTLRQRGDLQHVAPGRDGSPAEVVGVLTDGAATIADHVVLRNQGDMTG
jgi:hypothetical protein